MALGVAAQVTADVGGVVLMEATAVAAAFTLHRTTAISPTMLRGAPDAATGGEVRPGGEAVAVGVAEGTNQYPAPASLLAGGGRNKSRARESCGAHEGAFLFISKARRQEPGPDITGTTYLSRNFDVRGAGAFRIR